MIDDDELRPTYVSQRGLTVVLVSVAVALVVVSGFLAYWHHAAGVFVVITNRQSTPITDVVLHVTGQSIQVGQIDAGQLRRVKVCPTGDSHLEFEFKDSAWGASGRLTHECYFGPYFHGQIELNIDEGGIGMQDDL